MSLSKTFNADGDRKAQLDLLEKALQILNAQKEASHRTRSMHGEIAETRRYIWQWGGDTGGEDDLHRPLDNNPRADEIRRQQQNLQAYRQNAVQEIARYEGPLVAVMTKIFGGDAAKLKAFYAGAEKLDTPQAQQWTDVAAHKYRHPKDAPIDSTTAVTAATVKFTGLQLIEQQTSAINAMIDQGKFLNTAKRVAWQVGQSFRA